MIDYDGISSFIENLRDSYDNRMIPELIEAMNDGTVVRCSITYYWEICYSCSGEGSHSKHLGVIDSETWNDWEDESRHAYIAGHYDKQCDLCSGSGKIKVLDIDSLNDSAKQWVEDYINYMEDDLMYRRSEMMMGA
jgi:hypothetical protein